MAAETVPDTLNEVGVLNRREIEARIVAPLLQRLAGEFGERVYEIAGDAIIDIAREQGAALAEQVGDTTLPAFAQGLLLPEEDHPLVTISPGPVAQGAITPPGHMQKE